MKNYDSSSRRPVQPVCYSNWHWTHIYLTTDRNVLCVCLLGNRRQKHDWRLGNSVLIKRNPSLCANGELHTRETAAAPSSSLFTSYTVAPPLAVTRYSFKGTITLKTGFDCPSRLALLQRLKRFEDKSKIEDLLFLNRTFWAVGR